MQVTVRAYGDFREAIGANETTVTVPDGATVADVLDALDADHPAFDADDLEIAMVDRTHVDRDATLSDGTTLVLNSVFIDE